MAQQFLCDVLLSRFLVCWCFVAKLFYLIIAGWLYHAVLLISFKTWPICLPYLALGTCPERRYWLSVPTHVFVECYGNVRGTDIESLCGRSKLGSMAPDTFSLVFPFSGLALSQILWFLWLWLDALQKILHTLLSGALQKYFQLGLALAKASPDLKDNVHQNNSWWNKHSNCSKNKKSWKKHVVEWLIILHNVFKCASNTVVAI